MRKNSMTRSWIICLLISLLTLMSCNRRYEPGDYYSKDVSGIVLAADAEGNAMLLLSLEEAKDIVADSAALWAETLGDGLWRLPTKEDMSIIKKYKSLINKTLEYKKQPTVLSGHTFYWTATPCSESHTYACGPDGINCYFKTNATPHYRARAVKDLKVE